MRRLCSDYEKQILHNNRSNILSGTLESKRGNGIAAILIGLILGFLLGIPIAFFVKSSDQFVIQLILYSCIGVMIGATQLIFSKFTVTWNKNNIFKKHNVTINGATVIGVNPSRGFVLYVEDDFNDPYGRPYKIALPLADYSKVNAGSRIIVVSAAEGSYFLMNTSEETKNMIPAYCNYDLNYINLNNGWSPVILPHPNALYIDPGPRILSDQEKEEFFTVHSRINSMGTKALMGVMGVLLYLILFVIIAILFSMEIIPILFAMVLFVLGVPVSIWLVILFKKLIRKRSGKSLSKVSFIKRVMLSSFQLDYTGYGPQSIIYVYEWENGSYSLKSYANPQYYEKNTYGTILNMYGCGKLIYFSAAK